MRLLICAAMVAASAASAQTATFAPQITASGLTLWSVTASAPGRASLPAAAIYQVAAAHGVGHVDSSLVGSIQAGKPSRWTVGLEIGGALGAVSAIGATIKSDGLFNSATATKVQGWGIGIAGVAAIALPYFQKAAPPSIPVLSVLGASLPLDASGSGSAFFYSLPSKVQTFADKLP